MNIDLRLGTYLMVEESPAKAEASAFIDWLQAKAIQTTSSIATCGAC